MGRYYQKYKEVEVNVNDSLTNFVSGMKTRKDSTSHSFWSDVNIERDYRQLSAAYRRSWSTNKLVNIVANDMVREWRNFSSVNDRSDQIKLIEKEEKRLGLVKKTNEALRWARLYGGSAMILNIKGQEDLSIPLDVNSISKGDLLHINIIERPFITVFETGVDFFNPSSESFDEPEFYWLANSTMKVHRTRVITFKGEPSSRAVGNLNDFFWGYSVISNTIESINNSETVNNVITSLVSEANVDIFKIKDLSAILAGTCGAEELEKKFTKVNELKSIFNMLLIDGKGEEYERKAINFANLPQLQDMYLKVLSAAADIPATRFLNEGATGLSDTGENDLRIYYDIIALKQRLDMEPQFTVLDEVLFRSALGFMPDDIDFDYPSLWQISDDVKADIELKNSQADIAYFNAGILSQETILKSLQKDSRYQISDEDIEAAQPLQFTNEDFDGQNTRDPGESEQDPAPEQDNSSESEPPVQS